MILSSTKNVNQTSNNSVWKGSNKRSQNFIHSSCNYDYYHNHNYIKILESDWSSAGLISAVIGQLHTSCACNWTVVRVMPE